ncbi:glutathione S-transferase [Xylariomycetidae sp. FL2044]|nr:glutathione S-transferase [Xylariomycetidae sp. FL2044]KAH9892289.1 glutathione S-transferase [Xylariomycetidae sp. FL2044]
MQPIKIWHGLPGSGPNPWKANIVLAELGVPCETVWISYGDIKSEPYTTTLNPNGRVPAIVDPNTGVTLFESGAIVNYLVDTYDAADHKISYDGKGKESGTGSLEDKYLLQSWLMFQVSGHGPMLGQRMWFLHFHVEAGLTTALDRYARETKRHLGVVESALKRQRETRPGLGPEDPVWLVGDKCTFADLMFVSWNTLVFAGMLFPDGGLDLKTEFPELCRWHRNMIARPAVKKVLEYRDECIRTLENTAAPVIREQPDGRK